MAAPLNVAVGGSKPACETQRKENAEDFNLKRNIPSDACWRGAYRPSIGSQATKWPFGCNRLSERNSLLKRISVVVEDLSLNLVGALAPEGLCAILHRLLSDRLPNERHERHLNAAWLKI